MSRPDGTARPVLGGDFLRVDRRPGLNGETQLADEISDRKSPGFWFYTADFERDMQILPLAAQGLWIRMMCWASDNEEHRGFLELPTGHPMTDIDIAHRVGKPIREVRNALDAMKRLGTFSEDSRGCIFSRRMARDTHISSVRKQAALKRADIARRATGEFAPRGQVICSTPRQIPLSELVSPDGSETVDTIESSKLPNFAGAKRPAKPEQNPAVTASSSASVSDSVKEKRNPPVSPWSADEVFVRFVSDFTATGAAVIPEDFVPAYKFVWLKLDWEQKGERVKALAKRIDSYRECPQFVPKPEKFLQQEWKRPIRLNGKGPSKESAPNPIFNMKDYGIS